MCSAQSARRHGDHPSGCQGLPGAVADYDPALALNRVDSLAYHQRGLAYVCQNDTDRASADDDQAVKFNPQFALAHRSRGAAYFNQGNYQQAIVDYSQAITLNANDVEAHPFRGLAYSTQGLTYNRAIELAPDNAVLLYNRGSASG